MAHSLLHEIYDAQDLARLLSYRLFGATPCLFEEDSAAWIDWRCRLADGLGVDDHGVLMVGSAAFGISLHPDKDFRSFSATSDIDVAVLSHRYFDAAWFELREIRDKKWLNVPTSVKNELRNFAPNYVFSGAIATERLIGRLSFGKSWILALNEMASQAPTQDRRIRVRLYRDAEALRAYQLRSFRSAKEALLSAGGP